MLAGRFHKLWCEKGHPTKAVVDLAQYWRNEGKAACATGKGQADRL